MPPLGVPAAVELAPEFEPALLHLEKHSHIWVLAWLESAGRDALQVTPRGVRDQGPSGLHGVFGLRSPTRPNPIGLTAARITGRQGLRIELDRLDFSDGTPVIDLKAYFVTRDCIFSATNAQIGRPASREALKDALLMQGEMYCGARTPEVELAAEIVSRFRAEVLEFVDPQDWRITVPAARPALADAITAMTRATAGQGSLIFSDEDAVSIEHGGRIVTFPLDA
jgi:tRNA-Thr(GGU) m(6)t(6)A37 methyltransferase TsaA